MIQNRKRCSKTGKDVLKCSIFWQFCPKKCVKVCISAIAHRTPKKGPHARTSRTLSRMDFARTFATHALLIGSHELSSIEQTRSFKFLTQALHCWNVHAYKFRLLLHKIFYPNVRLVYNLSCILWHQKIGEKYCHEPYCSNSRNWKFL